MTQWKTLPAHLQVVSVALLSRPGARLALLTFIAALACWAQDPFSSLGASAQTISTGTFVTGLVEFAGECSVEFLVVVIGGGMLALSAVEWEGWIQGTLGMPTSTYQSINLTATLLGIDCGLCIVILITFLSALLVFALLWSGALRVFRVFRTVTSTIQKKPNQEVFMISQSVRFPFRADQWKLISIPVWRSLRRSVLLPIAMTGFATAVHAASIDTGDITAQASALLTVFQVIAAIAAVVAIIFAALSIRGRNIGEGIVSLLCAIGAIFIIGHAQGWVTSITGISVQ